MRSVATWLKRSATIVTGALLTSLCMAVAPATAQAASTFNVGQQNILYTLSFEQFKHDFAQILTRTHMVGLNEVSQRKDYLKQWAANNNWHFYAPGTGAASANALMANKNFFDVITQGSKYHCDSNVAGSGGARYTNWVLYRHIATGRQVYHLHTHAYSRIDNNGHPSDDPNITCAEYHFLQLRQMAVDKRQRGEVIVTGDLNVDYVNDRRVRYQKFPFITLENGLATLPALRSTYSIYGVKGTGTHGDRHIDYIYHWRRLNEYRKIFVQDYYILGGTYSDHNGVVANYQIVA